MAKKDTDLLINIPYENLMKKNTEELNKIVNQLIKTANSRVSRLRADPVGSLSPALRIIDKTGKKLFHFKADINKSKRNQLLQEYSNLKRFLSAKSSTLSGWKKIRSNVAKQTGSKKLFRTEFKSKRSATIWRNREKQFWDLYNKLVDNYGGIITQLDSKRIQKMLMKVESKFKYKKTSQDKVFEIMMNYISNLYEGFQEGTLVNESDIEELENEFLM